MSQSLQEISTEAECIVQLFPIEENLDEIDLHPELIFAEQDLKERQEMLLNWVDREEKSRLFYDSDLDKTYSDIIEAIKNVAPSTFDKTFTTANSEEHDGAENWNTQIDRLDLDLEIFRQKYREVLYKDNDPTLSSQEVHGSIVLPASSQEAPKSKRKNANTTTKNRNATKKRKRGENKKVKQEKKQKENIKVEQDQTKENIEIKNHPESQNAEIKQEESEDCIDIETVSDEIPVLQAPDAESLLEQFEASQIPMPCNKSEIKRNSIPYMNSAKAQQVIKKEDQSNMLKKSRRTCMPQKTSPPQEVIDRIKLSTQVGSEARCTNAKRLNHRNLVSIHREHDYCRIPNCSTSTGKILNLPNSTLNQNKMINKTIEHDSNSKKHFTTLEKLPCNTVPKLTKTTIPDETKKQATPLQQSNEILLKSDKTINNTPFENKYERCQKIPLKQFQENNSSSMINVPNDFSKKRSVCAEKKIRSALAESIIRSRNNMKVGGKVQMVSVLKKPPNVSQPSLLNNSPSDNVASSPSSVSKCLEQIQNSVVQNTPELPSHEEEKKQPRKKLGLAEYRNRRDLNSSSKTNSPAQRIPLHYIYHAYTTTEPLRDCGTGDRIWSEREYTTSVSENKARNKAELLTRSIGIQTGEDDMECSKSSVAEGSEERKGNDVKLEHKTEESSDNRHNLSSSSSKSSLQTGIKRKRSRSRSQSVIIIGTYDSRNKSRSRSNSKSRRKKSRSKRSRSITTSRSRSNTRSRSRSNTRSRSRSYTRSRSRSNIRSRSRSRSRSHRYSNTRQRRLSNRRSSVSSTSSWSSRSGKTSRSSSKSKTSPRYRSRSRSPRSNFRRNKRLSRYRSNERERNYDKYQRHSSRNHTYRDSRSPPKHSYRRSYNSDRYNREKMTEVEERKIIFVGGLTNESEQDLHDRFKKFGPIKYINLPTNGNDFGFITFCNREDAWHAKEHGNDDPSLPKYNLSFGGRKLFCKAEYADLDDVSNNSPVNRLPQTNEYEESNYLALLREFQADTKFKKKV